MKDIVLIDSIGCIFNIRDWLNECIAAPNLMGQNNEFNKLEFEQLTSPKFIDNYTGKITPPPANDEAFMNGLMTYRSPRGINLVEGTEKALVQLAKLSITPVIVIPAGPSYEKLKEQCIIRGLICHTIKYRHIANKYPEYILDNDDYNIRYIIDDSRTTASAMHEKGIPSILLKMPWNKGDTTAIPAESWNFIINLIETNHGTGNIT